ncbi:hypothetical protein LCGC14_0884000 [marine sediment metagenome]|uniref:Uncharacterized protein n=1 Tax=marine sediment metagenome TaxID=412755 RepID=A0A0F9PLQ3_9ZZZZ
MTRSLRQRTLYEVIRDIVDGQAQPHEILETLDMNSMDLYSLRTHDGRGRVKNVSHTTQIDLKRFREWVEENAPEHLEYLDAAVVERALDGKETPEHLKEIAQLFREGKIKVP